MGWLKSLFVSDKNLGKIVDAGISAGDKLFYTDEEKEEGRQKIREWYLNLLDSMKAYNVAMRLLAVGVFSAWGLHLIASTGAYIAAFFLCSPEAEFCQMALLASKLENQMEVHINAHFSTIIMFYFGAAGINSIVATAKGSK